MAIGRIVVLCGIMLVSSFMLFSKRTIKVGIKILYLFCVVGALICAVKVLEIILKVVGGK